MGAARSRALRIFGYHRAMPPASYATLVGSIGVSLLLLAFFLNLFKLLRVDGYPVKLSAGMSDPASHFGFTRDGSK